MSRPRPALVGCASCGAAVPDAVQCSRCTAPLAASSQPVDEGGRTPDALPGIPTQHVVRSFDGAPLPADDRRTPTRARVHGTALAALAVCAYLVLGVHQHHTITGFVSTTASGSGDDVGDECSSDEDDIRPGAGVAVSDSAGDTVTSTALRRGVFDGHECRFAFTATGVPKSDHYTVAVADGHGDLTYSWHEMLTHHWSVQISIGDDA